MSNAADLAVPLNPDSNGSGAFGYYNPNDPSRRRAEPKNFAARIQGMEGPVLLRYMRFTNVLLSLFQALTGFMGIFNLVVLNITSFLIALYVILFALLLLAFECRLSSMETTIQENFGFLYTYYGRTAFIFFVGFLDFGMGDKMAWVAGMLMCANAMFNCFVMWRHPDFVSGKMTIHMDPRTGYATGEEETAAFLAKNPNIVASAGKFAIGQMSSGAPRSTNQNNGYAAPPYSGM